MSGAIDALTKEEEAELRQMQVDDAASEPVEEVQQPGEPASETEVAPAEETPPPPAPEEQKHVPKQALDQERDRRKKLEAQLAEQNTKYAADLARTQERLNLLTQAATAAVTPAAQPAGPAPDPQQDPLGYVQHVTGDLQAKINGLEQKLAQSDGVQRQVLESQLQQAQLTELNNWANAQEAAQAAQAPDYQVAMRHLMETRARQLELMGFSGQQRDEAIRADYLAMAARAREANLPFGQVLYGLAQSVGYHPRTGAVGQVTEVPASPLSPAPVTQPTAPTPAQRVATAQRGADMATGLGNAGTAPRGELTATQLAAMPEQEFNELYAKVRGNPAMMKQLFGD